MYHRTSRVADLVAALPAARSPLSRYVVYLPFSVAVLIGLYLYVRLVIAFDWIMQRAGVSIKRMP